MVAKYEIKNLLSKIAKVGVTTILVSGGMDPSTAGNFGEIAEGMSLVISPEQNIKSKLQDKMTKCTWDILAKNFEFKTRIIDEIVESTFSYEKLISYLNSDKADSLIKAEIINIFEKYHIPYKEQAISIDYLVGEILSKINEEIQNDSELLAFDTYISVNEILKVVKKIEKREKALLGNTELKTANDDYCKCFTNVLFLHNATENPNVNLLNLYVLPKYIEWGTGLVGNIDIIDSVDNIDIIDYLSKFINPIKDLSNDIQHDVLFIEGDAGVGKSSLVSFMAYHHMISDDVGKKLFNNRELICVRLRDITQNGRQFQSNNSISDILTYLNVDSVRNLEQRFKDSVIILDGFDELCMVENISADICYSMDEICNGLRNFKLIITTRPHYINFKSLEVGYKHISLNHFDKTLRNEWLEKYRSVCGITDNPPALKYISTIEDNQSAGICDTPMALYMLAAGKISEEAQSNHWVLYHQIFYKELTDTEYNSMFFSKTNIHSHPISMHRNVLYQLSASIAYKMYTSSNMKLYITSDEISEIIGEMENENVKMITEKCYALCNYWKSNGKKGALEFYHNNIRDFFLCEKIFFELDELYKRIEKTDNKLEAFISKFQELFKYSELPENVVEFIYLRTKYRLNKVENDLGNKEQKKHHLSYFLQEMLTFGVLYKYEYMSRENAFNNMTNIFLCVIDIYRSLYEPYLSQDKYINLWREVEKVNNAGIFKALCNSMRKRLSCLNLANTDLAGVSLLKADIKGANLEGANLEEANLKGANLKGANLKGAKLLRANLEGANLEGANLEGADLEGVDLEGADLKGADLERALLYGANLRGANLTASDISNCIFYTCTGLESCEGLDSCKGLESAKF